MIVVVDAGWATTVQDLGRPGNAHLGVSAAGMVDPALGRLVNRLVGNPDGAPLLETCGGVVLRAERPVVIATSVEGAPIQLAAGDEYRLPPGPHRLWQYLAVRGGLATERVLASASTDTLSGLGPPRLTSGSRLAVGPDPGSPVVLDVAPIPAPGDVARILPGPRADWVDVYWEQPVTVTDASRVGVRLTGARVRRRHHGELASEGLVRGAIQVPPSGELVMMLADHPTTGGYPVVAVVHPDDVAVVAQHRPGTTLRLRPT